jgi:flagellar biosynthesis/type III secretory pathway protein FliH
MHDTASVALMAELIENLKSDLEKLCKELDEYQHEGFGVEREWAEGFDIGMTEAADRIRSLLKKHFGDDE